jgi:DNA-binding transcriptional LysR family regulator
MDLRQLSYLIAVGDEGGVRAAGRRLRISQPSISEALRALEMELGVQLMSRTSRGVDLTAEGRELVAHARRILEQVGAARASVKRMAELQSQTLRIGLVSGIISAGELLAPILANYREVRPELAVKLEEVSFADQVTPLLNGQVDLVIVRGPLDRGPLARLDVELTPIAEEPRVLLVGVEHELADAGEIDVEDALSMATLPLASPDDWSDFWQLDDLRGGANANSAVAPASTVQEVQLAVATQQVVVSTPGSVARLQPNPLVRTVALKGAPRAVIGVARRSQDTRHAVRQFVDSAQETARRQIGLLPGGVLPA